MGQYYVVANIDKKEFISPSDWGQGLKLMEFAYPLCQSMVTSALAILLADGNGRGGGDLRSDHPIIGSWKYNRIAVVGDYADPHSELGDIYDLTHSSNWKNVSEDVLIAMSYEDYFCEEFSSAILADIDNKYPFISIPKPIFSLVHKYNTQEVEAVRFFSRLFTDEEVRYEVVAKLKEKPIW